MRDRLSSYLRVPVLLLGCGVLAPLVLNACSSDDSGTSSTAAGEDAGTSSGDASVSTGDDDATTATSDGATSADGSTVVNVDASASTKAVVLAAQAFLASLTTTQQATANIAFTQVAVETWTNLPGGNRNGVEFQDMSTAAQTAALALAQTALSTAGYTEMQNIRAADDVIQSTTTQGTGSGWGSALTHFAILGTPSDSTVWLMQICQHHLVYNITYNGAMVSATPVFLGTEPPNFTILPDGGSVVSGVLANGTAATFVNGQASTATVELDAGISYGALETQRAAVEALSTAILADSTSASAAKLSGSFSDVVYGINTNTGSDENFPFEADAGDTLVYPSGTTGRGALYSTLTTAAQTAVTAAIEAWVDTQSADIRTTLLAAYEDPTALAATYVGYGVPSGGATAPSFASNPNASATALNYQQSYLRIDGPRVMIEFVVQEAVAFRNEGWVHYHTVWRDKEADYGAEFKSGITIDAGATGMGGGGMGGPGGDGGMGMGAPPDGGMTMP